LINEIDVDPCNAMPSFALGLGRRTDLFFIYLAGRCFVRSPLPRLHLEQAMKTLIISVFALAMLGASAANAGGIGINIGIGDHHHHHHCYHHHHRCY
jgi:hypothetical protein